MARDTDGCSSWAIITVSTDEDTSPCHRPPYHRAAAVDAIGLALLYAATSGYDTCTIEYFVHGRRRRAFVDPVQYLLRAQRPVIKWKRDTSLSSAIRGADFPAARVLYTTAVVRAEVPRLAPACCVLSQLTISPPSVHVLPRETPPPRPDIATRATRPSSGEDESHPTRQKKTHPSMPLRNLLWL